MDHKSAAAQLIAASQASVSKAVYMYDNETDTFRLHAKDVPKYASRLNSRFAMFLSWPDDELVGFEISHFSRLLHRMRQLPAFSILFTDSTVKIIDSVDAALLDTGTVEPCNLATDDGQISSIHLLLKKCRLEESTINLDSMTLCNA